MGQLQTELTRRAQARSAVGAAVGVSIGDKEELAFFGTRNVDTGLAVDAPTLFQIGSIGKTHTATAVMCLVEQGSVSLDDPVRKHVPELRLADEAVADAVTVRHLLNHTAGWDGNRLDNTGDGDDALARFVELMADFDQDFPPGERVSYNNSSYSLAGRLIEKVTGKTYETALQELILDPLGMSNSYFFPNDVMTRPFAVGHLAGDDDVYRVTRPWAMARSTWPAGGHVSNLGDLLSWGRFHLGDGTSRDGRRVLESTTLAQMQQPTVRIPGGSLGDAVGLSWLLHDVNGRRLIRHDGSSNGQFADLVLVPDRDLVIGVLSNCEPGGSELNAEMVRWVLQETAAISTETPAPVDADPATLRQYHGRYHAGGVTLCVDSEAHELVLTPEIDPAMMALIRQETEHDPNIPTFRLGLLAGDGDRYVVTAGDGMPEGERGRFVRGADGSIVGLDFGGRYATRVTER